MSLVFPLHKPYVLGHRGACAHAPENTLSAFRLAMESGADGVELDARLTVDGAVMVLHDATVDRVTQGRGRLVKMTQAEVERLPMRGVENTQFAGERIPSLQKVFETFGKAPVYDLEIKNFDAPLNGLEGKVLELVERFDLEGRVIITSFNPAAVLFFRQKLPQAPVGLLLLGGNWGTIEEALISRWVSPGLVGLSIGDFSEDLSTRLSGRKILVWGMKTPGEVRDAVKRGAVVLVSDDPGMARAMLEEQ